MRASILGISIYTAMILSQLQQILTSRHSLDGDLVSTCVSGSKVLVGVWGRNACNLSSRYGRDRVGPGDGPGVPVASFLLTQAAAAKPEHRLTDCQGKTNENVHQAFRFSLLLSLFFSVPFLLTSCSLLSDSLTWRPTLP